jgi:hypothetical protein
MGRRTGFAAAENPEDNIMDVDTEPEMSVADG